MSNDPAMALALEVGNDPLKILLSVPSTVLNKRLGRLEAILQMRNRTVADILELTGGTTAIKAEIQVVCNAFLIWKGLHPDLVRKYENVAGPGADLAASQVWIGLKIAYEKLRLITTKLAKLEVAILSMNA